MLNALAPHPTAVLTASSGNFGQKIAWAARQRGIAATVFGRRDR
jgi:threonine dehydratase